MATRRPSSREALADFLGSAPLASALATIAVGLGVLAVPVHNTIGWAGLIAILAALAVEVMAVGLHKLFPGLG